MDPYRYNKQNADCFYNDSHTVIKSSILFKRVLLVLYQLRNKPVISWQGLLGMRNVFVMCVCVSSRTPRSSLCSTVALLAQDGKIKIMLIVILVVVVVTVIVTRIVNILNRTGGVVHIHRRGTIIIITVAVATWFKPSPTTESQHQWPKINKDARPCLFQSFSNPQQFHDSSPILRRKQQMMLWRPTLFCFGDQIATVVNGLL